MEKLKMSLKRYGEKAFTRKCGMAAGRTALSIRFCHILFLLCLSVLLAGCSSAGGNQPGAASGDATRPAHTVAAKVVKVIDGDTFQVIYQKKVTTVRVLLIDTPETHHPQLGVQPYGPEASARAHELLDGKSVALELAEHGGRDKYGRLLAYVFIGGRSFESQLLESGLARVAYVYPPNTKYLDQYRAAEARAKKQRIGIWSVSGYARADGFHAEAMKGTSAYKETEKSGTDSSGGQSSDGTCNGMIKGNISSRGKIYHMPSDPYYKKTKAEACFKNRSEAEQAGFRAAQ